MAFRIFVLYSCVAWAQQLAVPKLALVKGVGREFGDRRACYEGTVIVLGEAGNRVSAETMANYSTITNASGEFEFKGVEPGSYSVTAARRGSVDVASSLSGFESSGLATRVNVVAVSYEVFPAGATATNDLGEYRITSLGPGRFYGVATVHNDMEMPSSCSSGCRRASVFGDVLSLCHREQ